MPRVLLFVVALITAAVARGAERAPTLSELLARLDVYLAQYERALSDIVSTEQYEQTYRPGTATAPIAQYRVMRSDFLFARRAGEPGWLGLRDVLDVDGTPVPTRGASLADILGGNGNLRDDAAALARYNARFNLGDLPRTINIPMLALDLMAHRERPRFRIRHAGVEGSSTHLVWHEHHRPTLIRSAGGRDQPALVDAWIDANTGAVLKTRVRVGGGRGSQRVETTLTVSFERHEPLDLLVPVEMQEIHARTGKGSFTLTCVARYSDFRRFQTSGRIVSPRE